VLRVRIEAAGTSLAELDLQRLRLHLHGDPTLTGTLYDLLGRSLAGVALVADETGDAVFLPPDALAPVGFAEDEDVIPGSSTEHPGHRLLQEYLRFAPKFHFFDLEGVGRCRAQQRIDILLLLREIPGRLAIERDTVLLGCTPVQNLFTRTTEPIRIDQRRTEYRVVADTRREATTEIHSLLSVALTADADKRTMEVQPFFSFRHPSEGSEEGAFWHARRASTGRADLAGTDLWLSFVDLTFEPTRPPAQVVYGRALCTNRELALQLPPGTMLQVEEATPPVQVRCLTRPTETVYPALGGAAVWKLVSTLSLNYLSLNDRPESLDALREILRLYNVSGSPFIDRQIEGIREMHVRPVATRIGAEAWRGFCRGTLVTLVFDETQYVGASAFLFASVLHRFFALHAQLNTFSQLTMRSLQREQEWKSWSPLSGYQPVA
jgi:type VI secretion system protein ImpG